MISVYSPSSLLETPAHLYIHAIHFKLNQVEAVNFKESCGYRTRYLTLNIRMNKKCELCNFIHGKYVGCP